MEYISAEEFLNQDRSIQEQFLEYAPMKEGDLYKDTADLTVIESLDYIRNDDEGTIYYSMKGNMSDYFTIVPLLTEGQLRKFIEDKGECIVSVHCEDYKYTYGYKIISGFEDFEYKKDTNLLQAYWELACKIAIITGGENKNNQKRNV